MFNFKEKKQTAENRPEKETYEYGKVLEFLEKLEKDPKKLERFSRAANNRAEDIFESAKIAEEIKPGDKVLYIGAGTGHVPEKIREKTGASVIMIDLVDLRTSDTRAGGSEFVRANARRLPFARGTFDVVCVFDVLHHTQNQTEILKELANVKKPDGKILVLENILPEKSSRLRGILEKLYALMDDTFNKQPGGVNPHNFCSISDWKSAFEEIGLGITKSHSWSWGLPDFLPGANREKRAQTRTLSRPFQDTLMVIQDVKRDEPREQK